MSGRVQAGIVALAAIATVALVVVAQRHGPWPAPWDEVVLDLFVGCLFIGSGVLVGRWRPGTATSWLLVVAGTLVLAGLLAWSNGAVLFTLGGVLGGFEFAVIGHLVLTLPDGRLRVPTDRFLVGSIYGLAVVTSVVPNLFLECRTPLGTGCPGNLLLLRDDPAMVTRTEQVLGPVAAVVILAIVVRAALRWRQAGSPARRVLAPPYGAALPLAAVVTLDVMQGWDRFGPPATLVRPLLIALFPLAVLLGVLRARARAVTVGGLIAMEPAGSRDRPLEHALATALGDPSARLLQPDEASLDLDPPPTHRRSAITADGDTLAYLEHDAALNAEPEVLDAVLAAARLVLVNAKLADQVRDQLADVQASRARLVAAQDEERRRVERDLHDGAQQRLVSAQLLLRMALERGGDVPLVQDAAAELAGAIDELRALARGVHPSLVAERGLAAAVEALAERATIPVEVSGDVPRLADLIENTGYFVVAEALTNVAKHADAGFATVDLRLEDGRLLIEVADDGQGGADPDAGSGLRGLRDRVDAAGGELAVTARPGGGTLVRLELPADARTEVPV